MHTNMHTYKYIVKLSNNPKLKFSKKSCPSKFLAKSLKKGIQALVDVISAKFAMCWLLRIRTSTASAILERGRAGRTFHHPLRVCVRARTCVCVCLRLYVCVCIARSQSVLSLSLSLDTHTHTSHTNTHTHHTSHTHTHTRKPESKPGMQSMYCTGIDPSKSMVNMPAVVGGSK